MIDIKHIEKKDYQPLASFLSKHWKNEDWLKKFEFLWDNNPAFNYKPIRGVAAKDGEKIVGLIGAFPVYLQMDGKECVSLNVTALLIDEQYRGKRIGEKIFSKIKNQADKEQKILFATTPTKVTLRITSALKFELIPTNTGDYNIYSILPVRKFRTIRFVQQLSKKNLLEGENSFRLLKSFRLACNILIKIRDWKKNDRIRCQNKNELIVKKIDKAGEEFDEFWEATKSYYLNTNIRDSKFLNWLLSLSDINIEVYACYEKKKVCGFIIVRKAQFKKTNYIFCIDLWIRKERQEDIVKELIAYTRGQALLNKFSLLVFPHFSEALSKIYFDFNMMEVTGAKRNDLYWASQVVKENVNHFNSYFSYIQGDRFFVKKPL